MRINVMKSVMDYLCFYTEAIVQRNSAMENQTERRNINMPVPSAQNILKLDILPSKFRSSPFTNACNLEDGESIIARRDPSPVILIGF